MLRTTADNMVIRFGLIPQPKFAMLTLHKLRIARNVKSIAP